MTLPTAWHGRNIPGGVELDHPLELLRRHLLGREARVDAGTLTRMSILPNSFIAWSTMSFIA